MEVCVAAGPVREYHPVFGYHMKVIIGGSMGTLPPKEEVEGYFVSPSGYGTDRPVTAENMEARSIR
jgi:hypothetical protein